MADPVSPNMNLTLPVIGSTSGPQYAVEINNDLTLIDAHDHSPGNGVQITPAGLNINNLLDIQGNELKNTGVLNFNIQSSNPEINASMYALGVDLYYIDGNGNNIRITQSGSVTGSSGTITGLPSGTASASYSAGVFTFDAATNTPANIVMASAVLGLNSAGTNQLTLSPPSSLAGGSYQLFLPAIPSDQAALQIDTSGNITSVVGGFAPTGVVLPFAGSVLPAGWLSCDGSAVSRSTYAGLFAVIGTTYGSGNGSTTFNLPNMSGNVPVGVGGAIGAGLGGTGGEVNHTLIINEMPSHSHSSHDLGHTHTISDPGHIHSVPVLRGSADGAPNGLADNGTSVSSDGSVKIGDLNNTVATATNYVNSNTTGISGTNTGYAAISIDNNGGGAGHNNVQPYVALNYMIKT